MTMRVTMTQTRMGESGSLLEAASTYTVSREFGAWLVGWRYATDTDGVLSESDIDIKTYTVTSTKFAELVAASQLVTDQLYRVGAAIYRATSAEAYETLGSGASDGSTTFEDVTTTTYTTTAADFASDGTAKTKRFTNAAGCLVTQGSGLGLSAGKVMKWVQASGAGQITFQGDGTSTLASASGDLASSGQLASGYVEAQGGEAFLLVGQIGDGATPKAFTSRALTATDDGNTLVTSTSQVVTVNTGLPAGFGVLIDGACTFAGTATVTDSRKSGETVIVCALINTGTDAYRVVGGKA